MRGRYLEPIDDDIKDQFLDLIEEGYTRPEAAAACGSTARIFKSMCNPESTRYDENFARVYEALTVKDGPQHQGLVEQLRSAGLERAKRSSDRLLEKYSIIYDPDWAVHKPQALQINVNIDEFRAELQQQPTEVLEAYVEAKRAELEQGNIVDAELA